MVHRLIIAAASILLLQIPALAQSFNSANVYWVGHSLISHRDYIHPNSETLMELLGTLAISQNKTYDFYDHTLPGAPMGWNWGAIPSAWSQVESIIEPLTDSTHMDYGTFDVMVLTESINIEAALNSWDSPFYLRRFCNAALRANPNTRLFFYSSWHHFQNSDPEYRPIQGPLLTFDWDQYMQSVEIVWDSILIQASDPNLTPVLPGYTYQGVGPDPGDGSDPLPICEIPTGEVMLNLFARLDSGLATDDWSFQGRTLNRLDFFQNPWSNYPADTITTVHPNFPLDDIHPSQVLVYLNALVHYAVIFQEDPANLPPANGVPGNVADIFQEVVWRTVTNNPRTCVTPLTNQAEAAEESIKIYPNPTSGTVRIEALGLPVPEFRVLNSLGQIIHSGRGQTADLQALPNGLYFMQIGDQTRRIVKH